MAEIRDLIYFDFDKAASLLSQIEGGLPQETQDSNETTLDERNIRKYGFLFFKPEFGGASVEKQFQMQTRVLHHDLIGRIEVHLLDGTTGLDVNSEFTESPRDGETIHNRLREAAYVRGTGWAILEDFERLKQIANKFNDLIEFIGRCSMSSLKQNPEFQSVVKELDSARNRAEKVKNPNKRASELRKVKEQELKFSDALLKATGLETLDEWLLDGIQFFIDLFMPNRILLSLFPFEELPSFQILANLKRDCFVDGDLDTILHAYGNRPNVQLTVMGLITSIPPKGGIQFDPFGTINDVDDMDEAKSEEEAFERAFRAIFQSFEEFYRFIRYSHWPNVTVHPIALYRNVSSSKQSD